MIKTDLQPTLIGNTLTLRPLQNSDFDDLYNAASDPKIWELHPDSSRYKNNIFKARFFEGAIASGGALAVIEKQSGRVIGSSRYYEWKQATQEISIGYTFLEQAHWGCGTNREMKALMLGHIFSNAKTVWFHVGENNLRSRKAVENIGAVLSHKEDRKLDGRPYVQLYYKLTEAAYNTALNNYQK